MVAGKIKADKDREIHVDTLCHSTVLMTFFGARNTENGAPCVGAERGLGGDGSWAQHLPRSVADSRRTGWGAWPQSVNFPA